MMLSMSTCIYNIYTYGVNVLSYTYLLLISILWRRQAIFESIGNKLSSSAECRIWAQSLKHQIAKWLNAHWQTAWAIDDPAKNFNSTARPYDPMILWYIHMCSLQPYFDI